MVNHLTSKIEQYMQRNIHTVHEQDTVTDVIAYMIKNKTNGTVVVDNANHVLGILSSWDIIKHIVPDYLEGDNNLAMFEADDVFKKRILEVAKDPISDLMTKEVKTAKKDDTLIEALALLARFHLRQLPIVNDDNELIGYINRTDIKLAVGDVLTQLDNV